MAVYKRQEGLGGKWANKAELKSKGVERAKILSEVVSTLSRFANEDGSQKYQDVCKVQFKGYSEPLNVNINKPTLNGFIEAWGEESKEWVGKIVGVEFEKTRYGGKTGISIYFIPEGFERIDDEEGYTHITKGGVVPVRAKKPVEPETEKTVQVDDEFPPSQDKAEDDDLDF